MKEENFSSHLNLKLWSPGTKRQCATNELCWPPCCSEPNSMHQSWIPVLKWFVYKKFRPFKFWKPKSLVYKWFQNLDPHCSCYSFTVLVWIQGFELPSFQAIKPIENTLHPPCVMLVCIYSGDHINRLESSGNRIFCFLFTNWGTITFQDVFGMIKFKMATKCPDFEWQGGQNFQWHSITELFGILLLTIRIQYTSDIWIPTIFMSNYMYANPSIVKVPDCLSWPSSLSLVGHVAGYFTIFSRWFHHVLEFG